MRFKKMSVWILVLMLIVAGAGSVFAGEVKESLFVNLTSNEMDRAAMAINFSTRV